MGFSLQLVFAVLLAMKFLTTLLAVACATLVSADHQVSIHNVITARIQSDYCFRCQVHAQKSVRQLRQRCHRRHALRI